MRMCLRTTGHVGISRLLDSGCRSEQVELENFVGLRDTGVSQNWGAPFWGVLEGL